MAKRFSVIEQDSAAAQTASWVAPEPNPKHRYTKSSRKGRKLKIQFNQPTETPKVLTNVVDAFNLDLCTLKEIQSVKSKVYPTPGLSFDTEPIDSPNPNQITQPPVIRFKL